MISEILATIDNQSIILPPFAMIFDHLYKERETERERERQREKEREKTKFSIRVLKQSEVYANHNVLSNASSNLTKYTR